MATTADAAQSLQVVDEFDGGFGWLADPDERMQRTSHALAAGGASGDDRLFLVDPVDADGLDDLLADRGPVAGVLVLLDRHERDAAAVARRHDVPVYLPDWMDGVAASLDAPVEFYHRSLPDSVYEVYEVVNNRFWQEGALYHPDDETLLVPEALGTAGFFRTSDERVGVHPLLRPRPPKQLARLDVARLFVGHGAGVRSDAEAAIRDAVAGARRRAPRLYAQTVRQVLSA
jgi:hypothetical protein